ncbi:NADH-quinone oxidoreductase subunit M [Rhizosaccharibacter radicis]|uniref:NADH-quinone oxidoreductase subunit M n=1 Tax=Rhizosaccharibacter radicis TaxID=2782605 RepID=A0ABT1W474_9PROT|nr:NADH-quinone oxidoreductase subunit M [Acetobacteraceae bacterium KSS12]
MHLPLLTILTFLPAAGALLIALTRATPEAGDRSARWIALWCSVATLAIALLMWARFVPGQPGFQFEERADWVPGFGISYHVGLDGISLLFVVLSTFLVPVSIVAAWNSIENRARDYMIAVLLLESTLIGLFGALDFVLFYVFYEATLIPGSLLIGIWGGPKRVYASIRFFLFTFGGSLFMLLSLLAMWHTAGTTDIPVLMRTHFAPAAQGWMFLGLVLAFGVKLPLFPLHTWLPDAYAEAPAPATALLSGVLAKAGAYGFIRFAIPMLPDAAARYAPWMIGLGIVAVIYAAIVALAQTDMKRLIAYSSFSHMGLVLVGLFTLNAPGVDGALFQMLSHGIIIAALFLSIAMLSSRTGDRSISGVSGVAARMPAFATLGMLFFMANIGLPGTGSFVGELLVMIGAIHLGFWVALLSGSAMILGAAYMLVLYGRVMFGSVRSLAGGLRDLSPQEMAVLVPLAVITLWMGIYPSSFTRVFDPAVTGLVAGHRQAVAAAASPAAPTVLEAAR